MTGDFMHDIGKNQVKNIKYRLDAENTGRYIGKLINESGLSDRELADMFNVSVQAVNKWRHGRGIPDIENLFVLSRMLGIKIDDMLVTRLKEKLDFYVDVEYHAYYEAVEHREAWKRLLASYYIPIAIGDIRTHGEAPRHDNYTRLIC